MTTPSDWSRCHATPATLSLDSAADRALVPCCAGRWSADPLADATARRAAAKWRDVLARIDSEAETLAACRASLDACSPAARRLLQLVELGRQRAGRARLGEINRAVNLSIKATSDWSQYGVDDFWRRHSLPLKRERGTVRTTQF